MYITVLWTKYLSQRAGAPTQLDIIVGVIGVLLILEAARRVVGLPMVVVALAFIGYACFLEIFLLYLPLFFWHECIRAYHEYGM